MPGIKTVARGALSLVPVLAATVLAALLLQSVAGSVRVDFEDLALGDESVSYYAVVDGHPIHCKSVEDADACVDGARARGARSVVLWLGNSQVHAINQMADGDENAPPVLFRRLRASGDDLVTFSQPNANLQEHYILFEYLRQRLPVTALILPVVFDDLRETGVRSEVALACEDAATVAALGETAVGRHLLEQNREVAGSAGEDLAGLRMTVQEHSEKALNDWLEVNSALWASRPEARGQLFRRLRSLRNIVFDITPQTKRRLLPGPYHQNLEALEALLSRAHAEAVRVVVYVPPLRDDVEVPYVAEEYERFKTDLARLAREHSAELLNLEHLIPGQLWGLKKVGQVEELDFMHFQARGHSLLAEALAEALGAGSSKARR